MIKSVNVYIKTQIWTAVILGVAIIAFNYTINPYDIYESLAIDGINGNKPQRENRLRMFKAAAVERLRPSVIIAGSSRANRALDPRHPAWSEKPVFNLAIPGTSMVEIRHFLEHAQSVRPLEQVVLAIDFFAFNGLRAPPSTFRSDRLRGAPSREYAFARASETAATLFSLDAVKDSITTMLLQATPCGRNLWLEQTRADGFRHHEGCRRHKQYEVFRVGISGFLKEDQWGVSVYRPYNFENPKGSLSSLEEFEKVVQTAYHAKIDMKVVILPVHAWQLEALWATGLWQTYELWKQEVLAILRESAGDRVAFPLWDFTAYNARTTEAVPDGDDAEVKMKWFVDASHMSPEFGASVLDKILGTNGSNGAESLGHFGKLLTAENIDDHLAHIRRERARYAQLNEARLEEVYRLVSCAGSLCE
jgi:hypothetical protein